MLGLLSGLALLVVAVLWFQRQGHGHGSSHRHGSSSHHHGGHTSRHNNRGGCH